MNFLRVDTRLYFHAVFVDEYSILTSSKIQEFFSMLHSLISEVVHVVTALECHTWNLEETNKCSPITRLPPELTTSSHRSRCRLFPGREQTFWSEDRALKFHLHSWRSPAPGSQRREEQRGERSIMKLALWRHKMPRHEVPRVGAEFMFIFPEDEFPFFPRLFHKFLSFEVTLIQISFKAGRKRKGPV